MILLTIALPTKIGNHSTDSRTLSHIDVLYEFHLTFYKTANFNKQIHFLYKLRWSDTHLHHMVTTKGSHEADPLWWSQKSGSVHPVKFLDKIFQNVYCVTQIWYIFQWVIYWIQFHIDWFINKTISQLNFTGWTSKEPDFNNINT